MSTNSAKMQLRHFFFVRFLPKFVVPCFRESSSSFPLMLFGIEFDHFDHDHFDHVKKKFRDFESKSKSGILPPLATSRCGGGVPARVLKLVDGFKTALEEAK